MATGQGRAVRAKPAKSPARRAAKRTTAKPGPKPAIKPAPKPATLNGLNKLTYRVVGFIEQSLPNGSTARAAIFRVVDRDGKDVQVTTPVGAAFLEWSSMPVPWGTTLAVAGASPIVTGR